MIGGLPKFTVVTPSLNQVGYIEETIRSVIDQEGAFKVEYFIMDGGSCDGSVDVIRKYADAVNGGRYPIRCSEVKIRWASEKDSGQSNAINRGLRQATGEFASYINSDDLYVPGAFGKVANAFAADPKADFIYGDGDVIDESGGRQWEWLSRPYNHRVMTTYHFLWNDFTNYIMQQATFWRTRVHSRLGFFDEAFHFAMDVEYWVRAGHAGLVLRHLPEKLGKFRMIQGTKSTSGPTAFWSDSLEIFRRYRGISDLHIYLAYYYFNLAKHNGWDLPQAKTEADRSLRRWDALAPAEYMATRRSTAKAYAIACFLIANQLQKQGQRSLATSFLWEGIKRDPSVVIRPAAIYPLLKQVVGSAAGARLDRCADWLISSYRRRRFDYRYVQLQRTGGSR